MCPVTEVSCLARVQAARYIYTERFRFRVGICPTGSGECVSWPYWDL